MRVGRGAICRPSIVAVDGWRRRGEHRRVIAMERVMPETAPLKAFWQPG
jgi:hypothetical protein